MAVDNHPAEDQSSPDVPMINVYGAHGNYAHGEATPWGGATRNPERWAIPFLQTDLKIVDLETGKKEMKIG